jgi:hypothetical protein
MPFGQPAPRTVKALQSIFSLDSIPKATRQDIEQALTVARFSRIEQ